MTRFQFNAVLIGALVVAFTGYASAKYVENKIHQEIVAQCNKKTWPKAYDPENLSYCHRYFGEHEMVYKY